MTPRYSNKAWITYLRKDKCDLRLIGQIGRFDLWCATSSDNRDRKCFAVWGTSGNDGQWIGDGFRERPDVATYCKAYLNMMS